jgi:hypothetical protein
MALKFKATKQLVERVKAENRRGYMLERKGPRKQRTLPMTAAAQPKQNENLVKEKPVLPVSATPPQNKTENVLVPTEQYRRLLLREKRAEKSTQTSKMTKNDSNATGKNKTNKDIGRKESNQHKCLFSYTEQQWPDSAPKVKAKKAVKKGQVLFEDEYNILQGNENPELYCKWVVFFEERFIKDQNDYSEVDWDAFERTLMQIVAGEAKEVVKATWSQLHPKKVDYKLATLKLFTNGYVKKELMDMCENKAKLNELLHKDHVHTLKMNVYLECKHRLGELIFGTDMLGRNSHVQLKMTMQKMRTDPKRGIQTYHRRNLQFQSYLPEMSWEAGAMEDEPRVALTELQLRQNLATAISSDQMAKLVENEHNIWTQPYIATINKLENYEGALKVSRAERAELAKVFAQSEQRNGKQKSNKRSRDSNTEGGEKPKCKTCGKHHHGECRLKKNKSSSKPWEKKSSDVRQMTKQLNFLMKAHARRNDDTTSVSDSDDEVPEWRKGMNETQAMYIATMYRADNDMAYDEYIQHIDPDEVGKYKKQYKKAKRSL